MKTTVFLTLFLFMSVRRIIQVSPTFFRITEVNVLRNTGRIWEIDPRKSRKGQRRAIHWLISSAVLISFLIGILCLIQSATPRTDRNDQLDLAAEGGPSQVELTIGEAIQALSVRH